MLYFDNILYGRHSQTQCLMYCDMALKRHFVELGGHLHLHKHTAFQRVQDFIPCLYTGPVFFSGFEVQTMFAGTVQTGILNTAELRYKELLTGCPMVQVTKANVTKSKGKRLVQGIWLRNLVEGYLRLLANSSHVPILGKVIRFIYMWLYY